MPPSSARDPPPTDAAAAPPDVYLLPRLIVLSLLGCALLAPEALRLPRLYAGDLRGARTPPQRPGDADAPPPPAGAAARGSPFYHPVRTDCEPSWDVPSPAAAPFCYTPLQCEAHARLAPVRAHGFFIESGAFDGVSSSHSLMFERHLCWSGLLVEPSDRFFGGKLRGGGEGGGPAARPGALFVHGALVDAAHDGVELLAGLDSEPTNSVMADEGVQAELAAIKPGAKKVVGRSVASLLRGMGVARRGVDLWVLDIESWEMQALNGLGEFRPGLMIIEVWNYNRITPNNTAAVREKCAALGYVEEEPPAPNNGMFQDLVFRYAGE